MLDRTIEHARWFATVHYAPFPVSFDSAFERFSSRLEAETLVGLSPVFFRLRTFELENADFRQRTFGARFCSTFRPVPDSAAREPQRELARQINKLAR